MSIRKNTNPRSLDLSPELQDILVRNGMQAHINGSSNGFQLIVQGHDSPVLAYNITERQLKALTDWGTNSANKQAYNTFSELLKDDFDLPKNFVHARNANGRVTMGLHGYRIIFHRNIKTKPRLVKVGAFVINIKRFISK